MSPLRTQRLTRRRLLERLGIGSAVLPFLGNLPSLAAAAAGPKQRLVIVFSPDGTVKKNFWPEGEGPTASCRGSSSRSRPSRTGCSRSRASTTRSGATATATCGASAAC
jgi:hypothetical protein